MMGSLRLGVHLDSLVVAEEQAEQMRDRFLGVIDTARQRQHTERPAQSGGL